ncbi:hypothetical protein T484DRAFT_2024644 [Baffinella frigidus]|nr:hypothetical protein T484DRAFT_2024644 [Cryptophyta sp. CCMP2293]
MVPDSPAALCGEISVGDFLVTVDDTDVTGKSVTDIVALILGRPGTRVAMSFDSCLRDYTIDLTRADTSDLGSIAARVVHREISWESPSPRSDAPSSRRSSASPNRSSGMWGLTPISPLPRVGENAIVGEELGQAREALAHAEGRVEALLSELEEERAARLVMESSRDATQEAQHLQKALAASEIRVSAMQLDAERTRDALVAGAAAMEEVGVLRGKLADAAEKITALEVTRAEGAETEKMRDLAMELSFKTAEVKKRSATEAALAKTVASLQAELARTHQASERSGAERAREIAGLREKVFVAEERTALLEKEHGAQAAAVVVTCANARTTSPDTPGEVHPHGSAARVNGGAARKGGDSQRTSPQAMDNGLTARSGSLSDAEAAGFAAGSPPRGNPNRAQPHANANANANGARDGVQWGGGGDEKTPAQGALTPDMGGLSPGLAHLSPGNGGLLSDAGRARDTRHADSLSLGNGTSRHSSRRPGMEEGTSDHGRSCPSKEPARAVHAEAATRVRSRPSIQPASS